MTSEREFEYSKLLSLSVTTGASGRKIHYWKVGYYNHANKRRREIEFQSNFDDRESALTSALEFQYKIEAKIKAEVEDDLAKFSSVVLKESSQQTVLLAEELGEKSSMNEAGEYEGSSSSATQQQLPIRKRKKAQSSNRDPSTSPPISFTVIVAKGLDSMNAGEETYCDMLISPQEPLKKIFEAVVKTLSLNIDHPLVMFQFGYPEVDLNIDESIESNGITDGDRLVLCRSDTRREEINDDETESPNRRRRRGADETQKKPEKADGDGATSATTAASTAEGIAPNPDHDHDHENKKEAPADDRNTAAGNKKEEGENKEEKEEEEDNNKEKNNNNEKKRAFNDASSLSSEETDIDDVLELICTTKIIDPNTDEPFAPVRIIVNAYDTCDNFFEDISSLWNRTGLKYRCGRTVLSAEKTLLELGVESGSEIIVTGGRG